MDIPIQELAKEQSGAVPTDCKNLGFGRHFTDYMFLMNYNLQDGWHKPRIEPRRDLVLHPACMVFHYGQEVFEGLKAYRGDQGELYLFRHRDNLERLNQSCERMVIPKLDIDLVSKALKQLLTLEQRWFPSSDGCALYIRPTVIATDPYLGVRPSNTYLFYILLSPVGAYYPEGFNPVSIYVSTEYIRAAKGGTGQAKTGGNYAASMAAQKEALQAGYSQVLWLDARERKYIEEVGTMNIFFRIADKLITSPLTQTILPGITRDSVLHIARTWGITVEERDISIDEVIAASEQGHLQEIFGSGTAAIISPVKRFCYDKRDYIVADGNTGEWANKFYRYLLDLQYGRIPDPFGWCERI